MNDDELLDRYDELSDAQAFAYGKAEESAADKAIEDFAEANPRASQLWRARYRAHLGLRS